MALADGWRPKLAAVSAAIHVYEMRSEGGCESGGERWPRGSGPTFWC